MTRVGRNRRVRLLLLLLSWPATLLAGPLFESTEPIAVRIVGPFRAMFDQKESREELPFVLHANGNAHDIEIRLRGQSRMRVCEFPPLRLDFRSREVADTVFAGQDKLKLVTHCRNHDRGETDLLQEYVVYRVLNVITDSSYRVRLLDVNYVDPEKALSRRASHRYAFVIESASAFAARVDATRERLPSLLRGALDEKHAALGYIFQYLVGNTDWSVARAEVADECCHNVDLYTTASGLLLIPDDFDLTGAVNARYAFPDESLRIRRVTQRQYRGLCMDRGIVQPALEQIKALEDAILAIPESVPALTAKDAGKTREYLAQFFAEAEDEAALLKRFERECLKPRYRLLK